MNYRPDIEGMRALAVLGVLAFHYQWSLFSGGFVGVDVFFVISSYLITRHILSEERERSFSFKEFYLRRARRLLPALFTTVALTLLAGIVLAASSQLKGIAVSSLTSIFSVSNIYFWMQSGYFDAAAIQKPLLHTWSLAVEEQFYLVWPILTILLVRYTPRRQTAVAVLAVIGIISILAAQWQLRSDPSGVYFLTPYRICEFALGAICAWMPSRSHRGRLEGELWAVIALGLMIYPVFGYSDATPFPGFSAMLPCLGAAMLISFNGYGLSRLILTNPVAIGIGKISYSLYLVHWPIYVFYRQWRGSLTLYDMVTIIVVTFGLAALMYKYIEQPFRTRGKHHAVSCPTPVFLKLFGALMLGLVVLALAVRIGDGWNWRHRSDLIRFVKEMEAERKERFSLYRKYYLEKRKSPTASSADGINIFIIGDSHAADIFNALLLQYPQYHFVFYGVGGNPLVTREDFSLLPDKLPNRKEGIARNEKLLYGNELASADMVVINTVFGWYKPEHLARAVAQIKKKTSAPIVVMGNYLIFNEDFPNMVVTHGVTHMDEYYAQRLSPYSFAYENELMALAKTSGFVYISKKRLLGKGDSVIDCPIMVDGKLFTYDRHHLSVTAAKRLGIEINKSYGGLFQQIRKISNK